MNQKIDPTNENEEIDKGRIALWLDPKDIAWLGSHCCCPENAATEITERCSRIRFRAKAALHKSNLAENS